MTPSYSVIVPTRDRVGQLAQCLASLAALDYPKDCFEVIVVDDGSRVPPAEVVATAAKALDVTLVSIAHSGPGAARNAGVAHARGDSLAFTDDDCTADSGWLKALDSRLRADERSVVGGRVVNALPANIYSRTSQGLQEFLYRWYHEAGRGSLPFFTTNNLAMRRALFDELGGFDPAFTFASEDRDLCDRATWAGVKLVYAPDAIVSHSHALSLPSFLIQHYRYGRGAVLFHAARRTRRGKGAPVEPVAFYTGMLSAPFKGGNRAPAAESLLLLVSQSASLVGFGHEALANLMKGSHRVKPSQK